MKVRITEESKKWLTVAEMPAVRRLIAEMNDAEYSVKELAEDAMNWIVNPYGYTTRILECSASICRNSRLNDYYFEGSEKLDVWIEFVAFDKMEGCFACGVYLSDIWSVGEHNRDEIRQHAYVLEYRRVEK
jgi:hypothetical protein